jgi:Pyruvate-formate lyase-activating enzyme
MKEARLWILEDEAIRCGLCPHGCLIREGKEGICGVRGNRGGKLYALTYGKVVSAALDPIEKKPLFHFLPGTTTYSLGGIGCTFRCRHCQNWEISQATIDSLPLREIGPERGCGRRFDPVLRASPGPIMSQRSGMSMPRIWERSHGSAI